MATGSCFRNQNRPSFCGWPDAAGDTGIELISVCCRSND